MIITGNRIILQSIKNVHLPLLRKWRNSARIVKYMEHQAYISEESHQSWYQNISNSNNLFFIVSYNHEPIGLIQLQTIDYIKKTAESGFYIAEDGFIGLPVGFLASLPLLDFGFSFLNLDTIRAKTHHQNQKAIAYNEKLGFEFESNQNDLFRIYSNAKTKFLEKVEDEPFFLRLQNTYSLQREEEDIWGFELSTKGVFINKVE
jgi:RimJ/RimL family protein N-acetyltransferase